MSLQEEGLYIRICAYIFETGRRVPLDDSLAAKHMGLHTNGYRKVRDDLVAAGKLQAHSDGWGVNRAEHELAAAVGARSRSVQEGDDIGPSETDADFNTPQDTLGDTPPVTPIVTPPVTMGVIFETANENNAPLIEPRTKSQDREESEVLLRSNAKPKKEAHGTRLDPNWVLSDDLRQWTRARFPQTTDQRVADELENFHDYWKAQAGQRGRKADWDATWRTWSKRAFATAPIRPRAQDAERQMSPWEAEKAAKHARIRALMESVGGTPS